MYYQPTFLPDEVVLYLRKSRSDNPSYDPMEFSNKEIDEKPVKIVGKVVELRRKF